jgi:nicotinamide riboside kinase
MVLLDEYQSLKKYYYGERVNGVSRSFSDIARQYREQIRNEVKHLQFIGLPTRNYDKRQNMEKTELEKVYIPLDLMADLAGSRRTTSQRILEKKNNVVVLGDPGTGKSTLAKYLALIHGHEEKKQIPFFIPIREYVRERQRRNREFNFIDYLKFVAGDRYGFNDIDRDFFDASLAMGEAIVLFDGLDEVASETGRAEAAKMIEHFASQYPGSTVWVTSRIVGYNVDVKLDEKKFDHYYIAPVTGEQAGRFVEKWYEVQIPRDKGLRRDHVKSLKDAMKENPGVKRLKTNPLLLTMMTLVHQFEGRLPDDRATLYERCIDLLLRTWQETKYKALGIRNPLEERDLKYNHQMRLLAAAAFYLQQKNQDSQDHDSRGLIEENELKKVLFEARFDEKRMNKEEANEDIDIFLDYIRDRAGLLVEKGRNEKKENLFAFVHLSFLEYLCAYQMVEDRAKSREEHIGQLLEYLGKPSWEEPILLSLRLFSQSTTGDSFIDAFCKAVFEKLETKENDGIWFLLGRAVRDNIDFSTDDIKHITGKVAKIWLSDTGNEAARIILKEIFDFSAKGKEILKEVIEESIKNEQAAKAFSAIFMYDELYQPGPELPGFIEYNNDEDLRAVLLLYPVDAPTLEEYIYKTANERQWFLYYYNAPDQMNYNLDALLKKRLNPVDLKGYIFSCWSKVLAAFNMRNRFLDMNEPVLEGGQLFHGMRCRFDNHADVLCPLNIFTAFNPYVGEITVPGIRIKNNIGFKERESPGFSDASLFSNWLLKFLSHISLTIKNNLANDNYINKRVDQFSQDFRRAFGRKITREIKEHFKRLIDRDFLKNTGQHISVDFIKEIAHSFTVDFLKGASIGFINDFDLDIGRHLSSEISPALSSLSRQTVLEICYSAEKLTNRLFHDVYGHDIYWYDFDENSEQFRLVYDIYARKFKKGNFPHTEGIIEKWDKVVLHDFEMALGGQEEYNFPNRFSFSIKNPVMLPVIFRFILTGILSHYAINITTYLHTLFRGKSEKEIEDDMIAGAVDEFLRKNPFEFYFVNFAWEYYAEAFSGIFDDGAEDESKELAMACFVMNAARVSLVAGAPLEGKSWERVLKEARKYKNPLVQISLTLYKLCNFQRTEENSILLDKQFARFKREYPDYYRLIGFRE